MRLSLLSAPLDATKGSLGPTEQWRLGGWAGCCSQGDWGGGWHWQTPSWGRSQMAMQCLCSHIMWRGNYHQFYSDHSVKHTVMIEVWVDSGSPSLYHCTCKLCTAIKMMVVMQDYMCRCMSISGESSGMRRGRGRRWLGFANCLHLVVGSVRSFSCDDVVLQIQQQQCLRFLLSPTPVSQYSLQITTTWSTQLRAIQTGESRYMIHLKLLEIITTYMG